MGSKSRSTCKPVDSGVKHDTSLPSGTWLIQLLVCVIIWTCYSVIWENRIVNIAFSNACVWMVRHDLPQYSHEIYVPLYTINTDGLKWLPYKSHASHLRSSPWVMWVRQWVIWAHLPESCESDDGSSELISVSHVSQTMGHLSSSTKWIKPPVAAMSEDSPAHYGFKGWCNLNISSVFRELHMWIWVQIWLLLTFMASFTYCIKVMFILSLLHLF